MAIPELEYPHSTGAEAPFVLHLNAGVFLLLRTHRFRGWASPDFSPRRHGGTEGGGILSGCGRPFLEVLDLCRGGEKLRPTHAAPLALEHCRKRDTARLNRATAILELV